MLNSSKLQSRVAKRRNLIRIVEEDYSTASLMIFMKRSGMIEDFEASLQDMYSVRRNIRATLNELADDQRLDKNILKIVYAHEKRPWSVGEKGHVTFFLSDTYKGGASEKEPRI